MRNCAFPQATRHNAGPNWKRLVTYVTPPTIDASLWRIPAQRADGRAGPGARPGIHMGSGIPLSLEQDGAKMHRGSKTAWAILRANAVPAHGYIRVG